jgi:hypothetical protein
VYAVFIAFGTCYIYKLLREATGAAVRFGRAPNRPMAFADDAASATGSGKGWAMEATNLAVFWVASSRCRSSSTSSGGSISAWDSVRFHP